MNQKQLKPLARSLKLKAYNLRFSGGFSLTEIILTASLFLLLAGVGVGAYFRYYQGALVNADIDSALTLIKNTRFKAMKNPGGDNYGVHLDSATNSLVRFRNTYSPGLMENVVLDLNTLTIQDLSLSPSIGVTNEILFENKTGKTLNAGTFRIGNEITSYTFNINTQGVVD